MESELIKQLIESGSQQKELSNEAINKYNDIRIKIIMGRRKDIVNLPRDKSSVYLFLDTVQILRYLTSLPTQNEIFNTQYELHKKKMFDAHINNDYTIDEFKSDFEELENMINPPQVDPNVQSLPDAFDSLNINGEKGGMRNGATRSLKRSKRRRVYAQRKATGIRRRLPRDSKRTRHQKTKKRRRIHR